MIITLCLIITQMFSGKYVERSIKNPTIVIMVMYTKARNLSYT